MSDLDRLQDAFLKADAMAQRGNARAREDAAMFAAEIRRLQKAGPQREPIMSQFNAGVADVIDFFNPFDDDAVSQALGFGSRLTTGKAADAMNAAGIPAATDAPEGFGENFMRGGGKALAATPAAGVTLAGLRQVPGAVGKAAEDAYAAIMTLRGMMAETAAGGLSQGAEAVAREQGAPEWAQTAAGVAAPMALAPVAMGSKYLPTPTVVRGVKRAVTPMTEGGAREVARNRLRDLAGGEDRAAELAGRIDPNDDFNLTPAQQIQDENLSGLERAVADENPTVREGLAQRRVDSEGRIEAAAREMGGNVEDARAFFEKRKREVRENLKTRIDAAISEADRGILSAGPRRAEAQNSTDVVSRLKSEFDDFRGENGQKWAAVPLDTPLSAPNAADAARRIIDDTPRAQQNDIPGVLRSALADGNELSGPTNAKELHGLYSELRAIARNARAGTNTNKNMARIADEVAEQLLRDMDAAADGSMGTPLGLSLRDAIDHTRVMHETFDQGAVGRILRRTAATDEQIPPETALDRTVGRGGNISMADDVSIRAAAPTTASEVQDYLRSRFSDSVMNATGEFTPKAAQTWLRNNREILTRYPELRKELYRVVTNRDNAAAFAIRSQERLKLAEQGPIKDFNAGQTEKAVTAILGADSPVKAARRIAREARLDTSGKALAGVKASFSDYLTQDVQKLPVLIADRNTRAAMQQVFSADEMRRLDRIASAMRGLQSQPKDVGDVINTPANKLIDYAVRIFAAQKGGQMGGGSMGGSLQTANIAVDRARSLLKGMTNDKARKLLVDAVQDPALMRELLTEPRGIELPLRTRQKLAPYLIGAGAAQTPEE